MKKTLTLIVVGALLGSSITFAATQVFSDVPEDAWYTEAVNSLSEKGIIQGYPDGTFGPNNNVNRAELAVMLDRLIEYMETGEVSSESNECTTEGGEAGFIMHDGNCYAPGETVLDTDCVVSVTGGCESLE